MDPEIVIDTVTLVVVDGTKTSEELRDEEYCKRRYKVQNGEEERRMADRISTSPYCKKALCHDGRKRGRSEEVGGSGRWVLVFIDETAVIEPNH